MRRKRKARNTLFFKWERYQMKRRWSRTHTIIELTPIELVRKIRKEERNSNAWSSRIKVKCTKKMSLERKLKQQITLI